jgi:hypothetical protein
LHPIGATMPAAARSRTGLLIEVVETVIEV